MQLLVNRLGLQLHTAIQNNGVSTWNLLSKMLTNMEIDNAEVYRPTNREKMV